MFEIYKEIKEVILKDPVINLTSIFSTVFVMLVPGVLYLLILQPALFIAFDFIKIIIFSVVYALPMLLTCFFVDTYYTIKYKGKVKVINIYLLSCIESSIVLIIVNLIAYFGYNDLSIVTLYLCAVIPYGIVSRFLIKIESSSNKKLIIKEETKK